jgi:dephospho-CoA kinase
MLTFGLTGNIASGKSAVAARLAALGAPVVDADILAREAVEPGRPALAAIRGRWGDAVLRPDGSLDRAALRRVVFADPAERAALDAIVHPAVARLRHAALETARRRGEPFVVCDIPLLFEAGLERAVDRIILVDAPEAVRRARLVRDRGLEPAEADAMIAAQLPSAAKRDRAHRIVENDGTLDELDARVDELWAWMQDEVRRAAA